MTAACWGRSQQQRLPLAACTTAVALIVDAHVHCATVRADGGAAGACGACCSHCQTAVAWIVLLRLLWLLLLLRLLWRLLTSWCIDNIVACLLHAWLLLWLLLLLLL